MNSTIDLGLVRLERALGQAFVGYQRAVALGVDEEEITRLLEEVERLIREYQRAASNVYHAGDTHVCCLSLWLFGAKYRTRQKAGRWELYQRPARDRGGEEEGKMGLVAHRPSCR